MQKEKPLQLEFEKIVWLVKQPLHSTKKKTQQKPSE